MNRRNPQCCCEPAGCCETITVKPLPLRTVGVGGVVSYSDTAWDASYVSGVSGTDNTIPANTTVTISVPIGCTDYAVDVEVLDDAGQSVTDGSPGLRIKVGDCLQAENYLGLATSPASDDYEWPTIISQHDADTVERDTFDGLGNISRPFYGDQYVAYRFYETFHNAAMNSGIASFIQPPYRFDVSTLAGQSVNTRRLPHDAGGLTVQITIETGSDAVEIGFIQVHAGHVGCTSISSLTGLPTDQLCGQDISETTDDPPYYTVIDPASFITNNGPTVSTGYADGDVLEVGCTTAPSCTFDYDASLDISIWTGNHGWDLKRDPVFPYGNTSYSELTDATSAQETELKAYLSKVASHSWTHSDVLIDWRMFRWYEALLDCDLLAISHTLSIIGTCNIVAASQAFIDGALDTVRDNYCVPSGGPMTIITASTNPCGGDYPIFCTGDPQLVFQNISYRIGSALRRSIPVIEAETAIETFFNLSSFTFPNASAQATPERDYSFTRSAFNGTHTNVCGGTNTINYGYNAMDIDVTEDATITKIPEYSETDLVYIMQGGRGSGFYTHPLATRDKHLQSLSLYVADESATFTASIGTVMIPTAVDYSGTRPDYATCGCPCTASTIYSDDLYTTGSPICVYWHRWMEFTDGIDTWYCRWEQVFGFPATWTFLFRRASDCKEIEFTGVSATVPSTANSVQKTSTNANSDTLSITVYS